MVCLTQFAFASLLALFQSARASTVEAEKRQNGQSPILGSDLIARYYPYTYDGSSCPPDPSRQVAIGPLEPFYNNKRAIYTQDSAAIEGVLVPGSTELRTRDTRPDCTLVGGTRARFGTQKLNSPTFPVNRNVNYMLSGALVPWQISSLELWHSQPDGKFGRLNRWDGFKSSNFSAHFSVSSDQLVHFLLEIDDNSANDPATGGVTLTVMN